MSKPKPCEYCGATYHQPYEDGLVECRNNLRVAMLDAAEDAEAQTIARVVAWLTTKTVAYGEQPNLDRIIDELERGDWKP